MRTPSIYKCLGGMLLVAGTAIGAGMLALPIATGVGGLPAASFLLIGGFLYMLTSLFLLLEANLYSSHADHNIISMTRDHLGVVGQVTAWLSFLLLLYAVSSAYISGGSSLIQATWPHILSPTFSTLAFTLTFGFLAFLGVKWMDRVNRVLMIGLFLAYMALVCLISPHIEVNHFAGGEPRFLWAAVPVIALSFTSHIILPSLRQYMDDHIPSLKKVLFWGSCVPVVCYLVWETMVIGILPHHGTPGLLEIAQSEDGLALLAQTLSHQGFEWLGPLNDGFSFFAMITSFLGVIISLFDFLADGLKWPKKGAYRLYLLALTFLPPLATSLLFPSFVSALKYAGVMVAILYGIIPVCIVWRARYHLRLPEPAYTLPGGKAPLIMIILIALAIVGLEIGSTQGWLPTP